jgi:hypothetical protein
MERAGRRSPRAVDYRVRTESTASEGKIMSDDDGDTLWESLWGSGKGSWERMKREGRSAYIWRSNGGNVGMPTAVITAVASHFAYGHDFADLLSMAFLVRLLLLLCVGFIIFHTGARRAWARAERRYGSS